MNRLITTLLFIFLVAFAWAQIQHGGEPISLNSNNLQGDVPIFEAPYTDVQSLRNEDVVVDEIKDIPWRYGYIHYVDVSLEQGVFDYLDNGDRVWRIKVHSEDAQTINLTFDQFKLAQGAQVFVYTEDYHQVIGSFTSSNNKDHGYLTTTLLEGETVTVELFEPKQVIGQSVLHLERIVHGYRSLDYKQKYIGDSGGCNNNVICPVGDNWRDQIRSVGILLNQNNLSAGFCTGALINNTCNDGTPYFLTANHCSADDPTTVVGFNFESSVCNSNSGPYANNTISGVTRRAANAGSDFMLLELSSAPPANYNVFFSGWDRTGTTTNGQVGIHHPAGDVKKISFDNSSATQSSYSGAQCWRIGNWEDGTTEGGSSGSPLYNLDGNIIGQLYGGSASCNSITEDFYGRFDVSWDNGSSPGDELKSWLDPCSTNLTVLAGYDPNAIVLNEDASLIFSGVPSQELCTEKIEQKLIIRNRGFQDLTSATIVYGVNGSMNTYNWSGLLTSNQSEAILLDSLALSTGNYDYFAYISTTNLSIDEDVSNDTVDFSFDIVNGISVVVNITTNFEPGENSLEIVDGNGTVIESEDNFAERATLTFNYCLPSSGSYCINFYDTGLNGLTPTFFFDVGNYQLIVDGVEIVNDNDIDDGYFYCLDQGTSIRDFNSDISFELYPNPNNGAFTINAAEEIEKVEMLDYLGRVVFQSDFNSPSVVVSAENIITGIYFIRVSTAMGTGTQKIVVN